jgi:hypothetical protein
MSNEITNSGTVGVTEDAIAKLRKLRDSGVLSTELAGFCDELIEKLSKDSVADRIGTNPDRVHSEEKTALPPRLKRARKE